MDDPVKFQSFYRMSQGTFTILLDRLEPFIKKVDTKFREAISPKEKLIMTLRLVKQVYFLFITDFVKSHNR